MRKWSRGLLVTPPIFAGETVEPRSARCVICVVSGDQAEELHKLTGPTHEAYARRIGADYVVIRGDQCPQWPIGNKWRIPMVAERYDRCIYLDVDTIVRESTPDLFEIVPHGSIGIHDDWDWVTKNVSPYGFKAKPIS